MKQATAKHVVFSSIFLVNIVRPYYLFFNPEGFMTCLEQSV